MESENPPNDQPEIQNGEDSKPALKPTILNDPVLGIPVLSFGDDAPVLTSEQVEEMLSDFP